MIASQGAKSPSNAPAARRGPKQVQPGTAGMARVQSASELLINAGVPRAFEEADTFVCHKFADRAAPTSPTSARRLCGSGVASAEVVRLQSARIVFKCIIVACIHHSASADSENTTDVKAWKC